MLLAYVDESYTADFFCLGAVLVGDDSGAAIEDGLNALVETEARGANGLPDDAELHGYEVFQGVGDWAAFAPRQRVNVYERAARVIGGSGARIVLRGMNVRAQRARYVNPYPPHEVVLGHLLESVNHVANAANSRVVMVADEVHTQERHRTNFRKYRQEGTPGYTPSVLPQMLDTLHFGPSNHSRLLQAADMVSFIWRRRCTVNEADPRAAAAMERVWQAFAPAVAVQWIWQPQ